MQDPNMQTIVDGITEIGKKAMEAENGEVALMAAGSGGLIAVLCQLNATLEEIRDALKEK